MGNLSGRRRSSSHYAGPDNGVVDFSSFTILRSIGRGSYGKVCIAQKRDTKELYAMKYMDKLQCIKEGAVVNILQELKILKLIHHPHIVNLRFAFHDIEDMCLVVDLKQGGDLHYHLTKIRRFSEHSVMLYLIEIGSALDYLHSLHIIHRDVKPGNLLLGLDGHVHLTDFNVATQLTDNKLSRSQCGTWVYMAPEIFWTHANEMDGYSYAVDWWSLGVTCYELSHGQLPFEISRSTAEVLTFFSHSPSIRYSTSLSSKFVSALNQMISRDSTARMQSVTQLTHSLQLSYDDITSAKVKPDFVPSLKKLNADPAYELEELIIESKPIHKKQSRLLKTTSDSSTLHAVQDANSGPLALIDREFEHFDYRERCASEELPVSREQASSAANTESAVDQ